MGFEALAQDLSFPCILYSFVNCYSELLEFPPTEVISLVEILLVFFWKSQCMDRRCFECKLPSFFSRKGYDW